MTDQLPSKERFYDRFVNMWYDLIDSAAKHTLRYLRTGILFTEADQEIERLKADLAEAEADARAANVRADQMAAECGKLRTALTGIQSCSTCEACRGAALRALRGEIMEAENMETCNPDWCPTCTKPYAECRCNGVAR